MTLTIILLGGAAAGCGTVAIVCTIAALRARHTAQQLTAAIRGLVEGRCDGAAPITRDPEIRDLVTRLSAAFAERQRLHGEATARGARLEAAIDCVSTCVLLADIDHKVVLQNAAARAGLPGTTAAAASGASLEQLLASSGDAPKALSSLATRTMWDARLDGRAFHARVTPLLSTTGERIGTVAELVDRSQERATESEFQAVLDAALGGDLAARVAVQGKAGFFLRLTQGINALMDNFSGAIGQVRAAGSQVLEGANGIAVATADLTDRTEQAAANLEETAASIDEMTSTVKQNAANAMHANQLALAARQQAEKGGEVVSAAVVAMGEIEAGSRRIADIIGVIDDIAFQTNLLALNAAVEAARAGDQGRGFAVVASEVRNLASRSAGAAREIKTLIGDSVAKVRDGSSLVTQSGAMLEEIVASVKKVTDIVAEITAASTEQSAGIDQINRAIGQLDEGTQRNAMLVSTVHGSGEAILAQARALAEMVDRYAGGPGSKAGGRMPLPEPVIERRTSTVAPARVPSAAAGRRQPPAAGSTTARPVKQPAPLTRTVRAGAGAALARAAAVEEGAEWTEF